VPALLKRRTGLEIHIECNSLAQQVCDITYPTSVVICEHSSDPDNLYCVSKLTQQCTAAIPFPVTGQTFVSSARTRSFLRIRQWTALASPTAEIVGFDLAW
jgi:hypothetical protein